MAATGAGWPFLIARGRRRGYSVLLAPGFLVADGDYGFLEHVVGPVRDGRPFHTATATTPRGSRVSLVWSDYPATEVCTAADLRDEHSRPLRLLGGFLSADAGIDQPSEVDLAAARSAAAATFERFLADEERFTIERSAPFGLRSAAAPMDRPRDVLRAPDAPRRRLDVRMTALLGLAFAVVVAAVIILVSSSGGDAQPSTTCPTTTVTTEVGLPAPTVSPTPRSVPTTC